MNQIVWLASYPKSGNTWVRLLAAAYAAPAAHQLDINAAEERLHAASRTLFDHVIGLEASELTPAEIDRLRPVVYRELDEEAEAPLWIKVHDCWRCTADGEPLFPPAVTAVAIYIVRDPRAVAPSFASHYSLSVDDAIARMADPAYTIEVPGAGLKSQLHQPVGTWSRHVLSWLDQRALPVHLVRYEDLHAAPEAVFAGILQAAGVPVDAKRLAGAVDQTRFDRLQAQEAAVGFKERLAGSPRFFRRGQAAGWRAELTPAQVARIVADHGPVMARLGYLDEYR